MEARAHTTVTKIARAVPIPKGSHPKRRLITSPTTIDAPIPASVQITDQSWRQAIPPATLKNFFVPSKSWSAKTSLPSSPSRYTLAIPAVITSENAVPTIPTGKVTIDAIAQIKVLSSERPRSLKGFLARTENAIEYALINIKISP